MPLNQLVEELRAHVPTDTTLFIPEFSTTTTASRHAMYASFCDLCSPYYNYGMLLCAFPSISIQGGKEDWERLEVRWTKLFKAAGPWFDRVTAIFADCHKNLGNFSAQEKEDAVTRLLARAQISEVSQ